MNSLWKTVKKFLLWIIGYPTVIATIRVEDVPDTLKTKKIYVVGESEYLWFALMLCPCGCGETLYMGLMPDQRPRWIMVEHNNGTVSLYPSVWRKIGCKSHFWLKHGKIIWCRTNDIYVQNSDIGGSNNRITRDHN